MSQQGRSVDDLCRNSNISQGISSGMNTLCHLKTTLNDSGIYQW